MENIYESEELILKFLLEYMKNKPNVFFYVECAEYYYTYDDIVKIHNSTFDCKWCYKEPPK